MRTDDYAAPDHQAVTNWYTPGIFPDKTKPFHLIDTRPFFDDGQLDELAQRALDLVEKANHVDVKGRGPGSLHVGSQAGLTYDVYTADLVEELFPELWHLYHVAVTSCLRVATGGAAFWPTEGKRGININVLPPQHHHEWHIGGPDLAFTSSMGLHVAPEGGDLCVHDGSKIWENHVEQGVVTVVPGNLPHAVTPVRDPDPTFRRVTCIMSWTYTKEADVTGQEGLPEYLYEGVLD